MSTPQATPESQETQTLLSVTEAAERLHVGERFVRRLVFEKRIPILKFGTHVRIAESDLDAYIAASRVEADAR